MKKRYLSVQKWLDYYWANDPKWTPLFTIGSNCWEEVHKIKSIKQIMFRLNNGWSYQPYGGFIDGTCWVYCHVTDHSNEEPKLKTKEELIQYQISKTKLHKFNQSSIDMLDPAINPQSSEWWYNTMPHKEKPIKIYVAGCDDSSYTQLVETVDTAIMIIEEWKIEPPENPETDWIGSYFTN